MWNFVAALIAFFTFSTLIHWTPVGATNILAVELVSGKSHWNVMRSVPQALTDRGHTVTVFTQFMDGDRDGYTEVDVSEQMKPIVALNVRYLIKMFGKKRQLIPIMVNMTRSGCDAIYKHRMMVDIMNGKVEREFDLVITEPFMSECVAYVATVLRVPLVYVVPTPISTFLKRSLTGHYPNPAATSHVLSHRGKPKTFIERFSNSMLTVYCSMLTWYANQMPDLRSYDAVNLVKPSVIFTNTHFITEPARPLTPDVVEIGGIHLTPPEPIPKDILEFIDNAPQWVIYFTFGSIVKMSTLPENVLSAFREALARVPQKVLWKYEGEMKDKPKNVMTRKWFPQLDILLPPM